MILLCALLVIVACNFSSISLAVISVLSTSLIVGTVLCLGYNLYVPVWRYARVLGLKTQAGNSVVGICPLQMRLLHGTATLLIRLGRQRLMPSSLRLP